MKKHKHKCFHCGDDIFGNAYYVRPIRNPKMRIKVDYGCMLFLSEKGIIDMKKTKTAK